MTEIKKFDAVVVGSGLGGLAAGALLAKAGYSVCLLERNFSLGGAASVYRVGGLTVEILAAPDLRRAQSARREALHP